MEPYGEFEKEVDKEAEDIARRIVALAQKVLNGPRPVCDLAVAKWWYGLGGQCCDMGDLYHGEAPVKPQSLRERMMTKLRPDHFDGEG